MSEESGVVSCPECGTPGSFTGQLICQGCFVPFSLMASAHASGAARDPHPAPPNAPAAAGPPARAPDTTAPIPALDPESEHTRIINVIPGALPRAAQTRRDSPGRALRLRFPGGEVVRVEPGYRIRLGREPALCPAVGFLARYDNLSRFHATVGVEADGSGWITDEGSTNGTYAHGYRLATHDPATLRPGDTFRLAADVIVTVLP